MSHIIARRDLFWLKDERYSMTILYLSSWCLRDALMCISRSQSGKYFLERVEQGLRDKLVSRLDARF